MDTSSAKIRSARSIYLKRYVAAILFVTILTTPLLFFVPNSHAGAPPINNECIDALQDI